MGTKYFVALSIASFAISTFGSDIIASAVDRGEAPPTAAAVVHWEGPDNESMIHQELESQGIPAGEDAHLRKSKTWEVLSGKTYKPVTLSPDAAAQAEKLLGPDHLYDGMDWFSRLLLAATLIPPFPVLAFICAVVERKTRRHLGFAVFVLFDLVLSYYYFSGSQASEHARGPTAATLSLTLLPFISIPVLAAASIVGFVAVKIDRRKNP